MRDRLTRSYIGLCAGLAQLCGWELWLQMYGIGQTRLFASHPLFGTLVYE